MAAERRGGGCVLASFSYDQGKMETVIALLIAGVVLMLLETVLPGMIAGMVGFGCLVAGVVISYARFGPGTGNIVLLVVLALLLVASLLWIRFFPQSRLGQAFVARQTIGSLDVEQPELLNQTGTALTNLRPSGTAIINGRRVDVVTEGSMIERDTPVKVVALEGLRVVVRAL
jgi:membrane-bound serine protease (ClpP class)